MRSSKVKIHFTILVLALMSAFVRDACAEVQTNAVAVSGSARPSSQEIFAQYKSIFVDDSKPGYADPFFPKKKIEASATQAEPVVSSYDFITLKGISGTATQRLALINNKNLAAGETSMVRTERGLVKVTCLEVKDDSAVIKIEGSEPKEIFLSRKY